MTKNSNACYNCLSINQYQQPLCQKELINPQNEKEAANTGFLNEPQIEMVKIHLRGDAQKAENN